MSIHWLPEQSCPVFNKLIRHEPVIQSKNSTWSAVNFKKHLTSMSCQFEPAIWSRNTGQRIPCFDRCQLIITWMSNTKEVHSKPRLNVSLSTCYLEYDRHVARLRRRRRRAYAPPSNTVSHDNHEKINSWVSFCFPYEYGARLAALQAAGAPLLDLYLFSQRCHTAVAFWLGCLENPNSE